VKTIKSGKALKSVGILLACWLLLPVLLGQQAPIILPSDNPSSGTPLRVVWPTEPGLLYQLEQSIDLQTWTTVQGYPVVATAKEFQYPFAMEGDRRFFRVVQMAGGIPEGFALIPAGAFSMGDTFAEGSNEELPVHTVTLRAFYMATRETMKAHWDLVRLWGLANGYSDLGRGEGTAENHPVRYVSWYDVVKWCNAASERDGLVPVYRTSTGGIHKTGTSEPVINYANNGYRLPSEAEWEKAARGGLSGQRFPGGPTITHGQANYYVNSSNGTANDYTYDVSPTRGYHPSYASGGFPFTSPVGVFAANGYGLYDMAGNVFEWCNDWYGGDYYASSSSSDPWGATSGAVRVSRGGCAIYTAYYSRVAFRHSGTPFIRYVNIGFRLARSL